MIIKYKVIVHYIHFHKISFLSRNSEIAIAIGIDRQRIRTSRREQRLQGNHLGDAEARIRTNSQGPNMVQSSTGQHISWQASGQGDSRKTKYEN